MIVKNCLHTLAAAGSRICDKYSVAMGFLSNDFKKLCIFNISL